MARRTFLGRSAFAGLVVSLTVSLVPIEPVAAQGRAPDEGRRPEVPVEHRLPDRVPSTSATVDPPGAGAPFNGPVINDTAFDGVVVNGLTIDQAVAGELAAEWAQQAATAPRAVPPSRRPSVESQLPTQRRDRAPAPDRFTEFTRQTTDAEGETTLDIYDEPAFREEAPGRWTELDPSITETSDGAEAPGTYAPVTFGDQADELVTMELEDGDLVLEAEGLAIDEPEVADGEVRYDDVAPGVDLVYATSTGSVKESLLLDGPSAPTTYRFHLADPSGRLADPEPQPDGGWVFPPTDPGGDAVHLPAAFAWEARDGEAVAPGRSQPASLAVSRAGDGFDIELALDPAWLADPTRKFPVTLDPTIVFWPGNTPGPGPVYDGYAIVCFNPAQCNFGITQDLILGAGTYLDLPTGQDRRVRTYTHYDLKNFPAGVYLPDRAVITNAEYRTYFEACVGYDLDPGAGHTDHCNAVGDDYQVRVDRMTQGWGLGEPFTSLANKGALAPGTPTVFTTARNNFMTFNVTQLVQSWVNFNAPGYVPNFGMQLLEAFDGTPQRGGPAMNSSRYTNQPGDSGGIDSRPRLTISWVENAPGTPTLLSAEPDVVSGQPTTSATLTWTIPTTGTEPNEYYIHRVDTDTGTVTSTVVPARPCANSENGWTGAAMVNDMCDGTRTATTGGLIPGNTYTFYVQAVVGPPGGLIGSALSNSFTRTMWTPATFQLVSAPSTPTIVGEQSSWTVRVLNPNDRAIEASVAAAAPPGTMIVPGTGRIDGNACTLDLSLTPLDNGHCYYDVPAQAGWFGLKPIAANSSRTIGFDLITIDGAIACQQRTVTMAAFTNVGHVSSQNFNTPVGGGTCDSGLGFEPWWSTVQRETGPNGVASVNVANGNLVAQHLDSTPIQGNGQLAYVLRRTYNSQAPLIIPLSAAHLGQRWNLNVAAAGDLVTGGITGDGLIVPVNLLTGAVLNGVPLTAVTMIDRDGTRHAFRPRTTGVQSSLLAGGLDLSPILNNPSPTFLQDLLDLLVGQAVPGLLGGLEQVLDDALAGDIIGALQNVNLCIANGYDSPRGVHLSLWRYVIVEPLGGSATTCDPAPGTAPVAIGYATMRPDRTRQVFDVLGRLVSIFDRGNNELRYSYGLNGLAYVWEPATCPVPVEDLIGVLPLPAACRALRFDYGASPGDIEVTDPAGRVIVYDRTGTFPNNRLAEVRTYDGPLATGAQLERWVYRYQGDAGVTGCTAPTGLLCDVVPPRFAGTASNFTRFSYATTNGRARVTRIDERIGGAASTTFDYRNFGTATQFTDVVRDGRAQRYQTIDAFGRVGALLEGTLASPGGAFTALRNTTYGWDTDASTCRPRDNRPDHNLCAMGKATGAVPAGFGAPAGWVNAGDRVTVSTYTPQGDILTQATGGVGGSRSTTYGYVTTYYNVDGSRTTHTDTPTGNGAVSSPGGAPPAGPLYAVTDRVQILGPRGNATGLSAAQVNAHRSTYAIDNLPTAAVGAVGVGTNCGQGNSGLVCTETAPEGLVTRHTYDAIGRRVSTQSPPAAAGFTDSGTCAAPLPNARPCSTTYVYEAAGATDVSGLTDAEGWLRAVVDPYGQYVAFAYDRAGNVVRAWDRDATAAWRAANGNPGPAAFPTTGGALPPGATETLFGTGSFANATQRPWRYLRQTANQVGNRTLLTVDAHGNVTRSSPPRGVLLDPVNPTPHDTTATFDANDRPLTKRAPLNTTDTTWTYDGNGNVTVVTDPRGNHTVTRYDAVNRAVDVLRTRGPWNAATSPPTCVESSTVPNRGPIPTGLALCLSTTAYDGHDQTIRMVDGAGGRVYTAFDPMGRGIDTFTLRTADDPATPANETAYVRSQSVFDLADNPTSVCGPRQFAEEPGAVCGPGTAHFSSHTTYDNANRATSQTAYREVINASGVKQVNQWVTLTASTTYQAATSTVSATDRRGNVTVSESDLNGRVRTVRAPHDADPATAADDVVVTTNTFSPAGDTTVVDVRFQGAASPTSLIAYRYDLAHRVVDTVEAASSPTAAAENGPLSVGGTNPSNLRTRVLYDPDGNPAAIYEPRSFTASTTNPDERFATRMDYDAQGRTIATWTPFYDNGTSAPVNLSFEDEECPPVSGGHAPVPVAGIPAYPAGVGLCVSKTTAFDANGNPLTVLSPNATDPSQAGQYSTLTWTHDNLLETVENPSPTGTGRVVTETNLYDGAGRQTRSTDATGWSSQTTYSADGLVTATQEPAGVPAASAEHRTITSYNAGGQPTVTLGVAGGTQANATTVTSYYADGLTHEVATPVTGHNAGNVRTRYGYDPAGNPTQVWSPNAVALASGNPTGVPTLNTFAKSGALAAMVEPLVTATNLRRATRFTYDAAGRKLTQGVAEITGTDPYNPMTVVRNAGTQSFTWSANGWSLTETGRGGEVISRSYLPNGLLASVTDVANQATVTNTWLLNGTLRTSTTAVNEAPAYAALTTAFKHHADGLQASQSIGADATGATADQTTAYAYNDGRALTAVAATGWGRPFDFWSLGYDAVGRPTSMVDTNGRLTEYARNADGTLATRTLNSGGTAGTTDLDRWTFAYDGLNRVTTRTRAAIGSIAAVNDSFHYDEAGRLDVVNGSQVGYDPSGNRTSFSGTTTTYRADNSIAVATTPQGVRNYTYHPAGPVADDGCDTYDYDGFDRVTASRVPLGRLCEGHLGTGGTTTYDYDGLDRQTRVTTPLILDLGLLNETRQLRYVGLSQDIYSEESTSPDRTARYTTTPAGQALSVANADTLLPVFHVLGSDGQGSNVVATTAGGVACVFDPDPWGGPRAGLGPANPCRNALGSSPNTRWFQDTRRNASTGNYQFGSRTYSPDTGTWLQPDSSRGAGAPGDLSIGTDPLVANRYSYVNGDPVNLVDPSGHFGCAAEEGRAAQRSCMAANQRHRERQAAARPRPQTARQAQRDLQSDEGAWKFAVMDTANQGDLSKADGNLSRDDVEAAAAGGAELERVVRQLLREGDVEVTNELVEFMAAEVQASARALLREDNSWEEIDTDRPSGFMSVAHSVLDVAGFIPGVGAVADVVNAGLYALEGDLLNAAISLGGALFDGATALRGAINGVEALGDAARAASSAGDMARLSDEAVDAARVADNATPRLPDSPAGSAAQSAPRGATGSADELLSNVNVSGPYRRPTPGTTASQRASVQDQPCHTCGAADNVMRADHHDPYFERYLRGDTTYAGALDDAAVGPQCTACSAQQGASYSHVSRMFNRSLYNMFRWMSGGV